MSNEVRQLLNSAINGCTAAFEELIEPYQKRIYSLMLKTCGNEFEASQLAQEVFVKVFGFLLTERNESYFPIILYRTADEVSQNAACKSKKVI